MTEPPSPDDPCVIDCPPSGKRVRVLESATDTDGRRFRFDMWLLADSHGPMLHVHPEQDEDLEVVSGRLGVVVDGDRRVLSVGESVTIPKGTPHRFWNAGPDALHVVGEVRPALRTEEFMRVTYGLARDGYSTPSGMPLNPFRLAPLIGRYDDMLYLARVPVWVQKRGVALLSPVGRLLGYDSVYLEYLRR
ncbi:cupin domain-containing protein [Salinigranum rubrum]|uniref:cupin domain-containing protein n=1 Tax=Salinigranum rubrum TaxID=755307 RepID=UPI0013A5930E|nr:cupin domain-containing protein [Salinigranum rubrum]